MQPVLPDPEDVPAGHGFSTDGSSGSTKYPASAKPQLGRPDSSVYRPGPQTSHCVAPEPEKPPAAQSAHDADCSKLNFPGEQGEHDELPGAAKVPAAQTSHAVAPEPEARPPGQRVWSEAPDLDT